MLKVQTFLKKKGIEALKKKYAIKVTEHPTDDRILLNYDQIESPKSSELVRDCRGLCLSTVDYSLISRSFRRFFNFLEWREDVNKFDWSQSFAQSKEDGSLLIVYYYKGEWRIQTRGSFGDIEYYTGGPSPSQLFNETITDTQKTALDKFKHLSFSFELCSLHNKIVRTYKTSQLFLLSAFDGERELSLDELNKVNEVLGFNTPELFHFSSIKEVEEYIEQRSKDDVTFEGIIIRDVNNVRMKVKSAKYLALHRLKGESDNLFMSKNLIGFVLDGEIEELELYFQEVIPKVNEMREVLNDEYARLEFWWGRLKDVENRKEFALSIPQDLKTKSLLFIMRDSEKSLKELWRASEKLLLKALF